MIFVPCYLANSLYYIKCIPSSHEYLYTLVWLRHHLFRTTTLTFCIRTQAKLQEPYSSGPVEAHNHESSLVAGATPVAAASMMVQGDVNLTSALHQHPGSTAPYLAQYFHQQPAIITESRMGSSPEQVRHGSQSQSRRPQSLVVNTLSGQPQRPHLVSSPSDISPRNESSEFQYRSHGGQSEWFGLQRPDYSTRQSSESQGWPRNDPRFHQSQAWQQQAPMACPSVGQGLAASHSSFTPLNYYGQSAPTRNTYAPYHASLPTQPSLSSQPSLSTQRSSYSTDPSSVSLGSGSHANLSSFSTQGQHNPSWGSEQPAVAQHNPSYSQYYLDDGQQWSDVEPDAEERPKRGRKRGAQYVDDYGNDKRPEFLERNRKAAAKCRAKKKADDEALQEQKNTLEYHNSELKVDVSELQGKLRKLREFAVDHRLAGCETRPDVASAIPDERWKSLMSDPTNTPAINALKDRIQGAEKAKFQRPDAIRYDSMEATSKDITSKEVLDGQDEDMQEDDMYENNDYEE